MLAAVSPDHMCHTPPPGTAAMQPPGMGWALEAWWWPSSMGLGYEHPARGLCQKLLLAPMGVPPWCPASPAWNKDALWSWSPSLFRADLGTTVKKMSVRGCELCTSAFPSLLCSLVASFPKTFQRWLAKLLPHGLKTWLFLIWEINKAVGKTCAFLVQQGGQHRVTRLAFWSCRKGPLLLLLAQCFVKVHKQSKKILKQSKLSDAECITAKCFLMVSVKNWGKSKKKGWKHLNCVCIKHPSGSYNVRLILLFPLIILKNLKI